MLHAFEQRPDAARARIWHRPVTIEGEGELLMLGADAKLRLRLAALLEPGDEFVARLDGRHVDLVASHTAVGSGEKGRDLKHGGAQRAMRRTPTKRPSHGRPS